MKNSFEKISALADELHLVEPNHEQGGCYIMIATPSNDSDRCTNALCGKTMDVVLALANMMTGMPAFRLMCCMAMELCDLNEGKDSEDEMTKSEIRKAELS